MTASAHPPAASTHAVSSSPHPRAPALLQGVLPLRASQVPADVVAGLTLAALAIPEVMGYTRERWPGWRRSGRRSGPAWPGCSR